MQYLMYTLGDESVPFTPPSPELMEEMDKFVQEGFSSGVLLATGGLAPTSMATKVTRTNGEFTITDGPFTEAKEIIGGWAIMELPDMETAQHWAKRFLDIAGDGETRIRPSEAVWADGEYGPQ